MTATAHLSPSSLGFLRVAAISPELRVADVAFNTMQIAAALDVAAAQGCRLALFPELSLTSYSCADLFYQAALLNNARSALHEIARATVLENMAAVVGLPLVVRGRTLQLCRLAQRRPDLRDRAQELPAHDQRVLRAALVYFRPGWHTANGR